MGSITCLDAVKKAEVSIPARNQIPRLLRALSVMSQISTYSNEILLRSHSNRTERLSDRRTEEIHIIQNSYSKADSFASYLEFVF